ncbi:MAG: efflux transporter periplasmic adaptor subunit [Alkalinema sp. CACIAM 70d]|nr:MAG: efflux transporter periplasmic adaptor subunit [Alkalinema sp. CACIAM 70d]
MPHNPTDEIFDETVPEGNRSISAEQGSQSEWDVADRGVVDQEVANPPDVQPEGLPSRKIWRNRRVGLAVVGVVLLATIGFVTVRSYAAKPEKPGKNGREQITPVTIATVSQRTVPIQISAIGHVQAESTVSVTPQATGRITGVFFKKGDEVRKGQLLFTLDDRTQAAGIQQAQGVIAKDQAQVEQARATLAKDLGLVEQARAALVRDQGLVRQARATLAKDEAQAQYAQAQSDRYNSLYQQGAISQDQAQQYATNHRSLEATLQADREAIANAEAVVKSDEIAIQNAEEVVKGDQAAIENAQAVVSADRGSLSNTEVQASYTRIYAPIDGRAGNILITEGNVVQANSNNPLVVIQKIRPIQVSFAVPETELPGIQKHMENGRLKVDVTFASNQVHPISGTLSFVNNTVDNATGTIQLIGDFDNADGKLFPGQFVNATLTLTQEPNATVVPAQAVQNGPNGQFVFVVKPDETVENVPVIASATVDGLEVIQKGVQPGDRVVTDGQANLTTGSKVRIKEGSEGDRRSKDNASGGNASDGNASPPQPGQNSSPSSEGNAAARDRADNRTRKHRTRNPSEAHPSEGNP